MYQFGSGVLLGFRTDIANGTPLNFGMVQEVTLDQSFTSKELYGQNSFALAVARGTAKFTGKAKLARISGLVFSSIFYGQGIATGRKATIYGEADSVPGSSTYTITVAQSATFDTDYGVVYAATGLPFTKVASGPATGQYSVSAGVYTFAAGDASANVLISYTYTVSGSGEKLVVANPLLGAQPTFQCRLFGKDPTNGNECSVTLYQCVATKLSFGTKLEDFVIPELDFSVQQNAAGNVMEWDWQEAS